MGTYVGSDAVAGAVGMSLGMTSAVAIVPEAGKPTVIADAEDSRATPFVVAFPGNAEVLGGEAEAAGGDTRLDGDDGDQRIIGWLANGASRITPMVNWPRH
jgi:molecular chaperone DnaK (HSP70)